MLKKFAIACCTLLLVACSTLKPVELAPYPGLSFSWPNSTELRFDLIGLEQEIQIYESGSFAGSVQVITTFQEKDAVSFVQKGFEISNNGNYAPETVELGDNRYGYKVSIEGFSTLYWADETVPEAAVIVSVRDSKLSYIINSIKNYR